MLFRIKSAFASPGNAMPSAGVEATPLDPFDPGAADVPHAAGTRDALC